MPDDQKLARLAARVGLKLSSSGQTLTTAESCTGGWIAKSITDIGGSSQWFREGFVTYSNESKHDRLGVSNPVLRKHGAVSEATARAMAVGALRRAGSDLAVAVTGIAGPGGGMPGKPVGTVWIAWAYRKSREIRVRVQLARFRGDRDSVRRKTVHAALTGVLRTQPQGSRR